MRRAHDTAVHMDAHIAGAVDHTPAYTVGIRLPRDKSQNMYVDHMLKFAEKMCGAVLCAVEL